METKIINDLKISYGITVDKFTPVTGGYLNRKWKAYTDKGEILVKQYSTKRFNKNKIERIETSLKRQVILEENGVPCPFLWQCGNRIIQLLDDETVYMVMDFCLGNNENARTITTAQMQSLGSACALMHKKFSDLPEQLIKSLPNFGGYTIDLLWQHFNSHIKTDTSSEYRKALLAMEPVLKQLGTDFFDKLPKGFTHEDFHSGNILFGMDCVSAIVDFDRNEYSYIWHDIGRAILSFAFDDGKLKTKMVQAFLDGYTKHLALTMDNIADALKLSWCIEAPWWIRPKYFNECDDTAKRFRDEILWLTEHWHELDMICKG